MRVLLTLFAVFSAACVTLNRPAEDSPQDLVLLATTTYESTATACMRCVQEEIIADLLPHVPVWLMVNDPAEFTEHYDAIAALGVDAADLDGLVELDIEHTDIWTRDYLINVDFRVDGTDKQVKDAAKKYGFKGQVPRHGKAIVDGDFDGWGYEPLIEQVVGLGYYDIDDDIAPALATELGLPTIETDMIFEGGAINSDGAGTVAYSLKALSERQPDWTQAQIEAEVKRITGARKLLTPPYMHLFDGQPVVDPPVVLDGVYYQIFGVNHIDEVEHFGPNHTVVIPVLDQEYVTNAAEQQLHDELEANRQFWLSATDAYGAHYTVKTLPDPGMLVAQLTVDDPTWQYIGFFVDAGLQGYDEAGGNEIIPGTYMNYVVSNGVVLVPKFDIDGTNASLAERDQVAVDALSEVYPGREVIQIDATDVNIDGGGIHCITQDFEVQAL